MSGAPLLDIARTFALMSLVSIGGANAVLPEIRRQVVDVQGWMTDPTFATLFAIASSAPGPNIILVSLIGWHVSGLAGLLVATLAIMIPSCTLAFFAARAVARWSGSRAIKLLKEGLVPVALGLILASGLAMMRTADHGSLTFAISLGTAAFVVFSKRNPLWALGAGTAGNLAALHLVGTTFAGL